MELEHLTVLLSFLLFPCVIFGLGLALLFLRRSFLLITHVVMIISLPCNISFIPSRPDPGSKKDKEQQKLEEENLGATYILLVTILALLVTFLLFNSIVLLLM